MLFVLLVLFGLAKGQEGIIRLDSRAMSLPCTSANSYYVGSPTQSNPFVFTEGLDYYSYSCTWTVQVPAYNKVIMVFPTFNMAANSYCGSFQMFQNNSRFLNQNGATLQGMTYTIAPSASVTFIKMQLNYQFNVYCPYNYNYGISLQMYFERRQCGVPPPSQSRIVGGVETAPNELPYQALVKMNNSAQCGGTLVGSKFVLTAAHCTDGYKPANIAVILGAHYSNTPANTFQVSTITRHPSYSSKTTDNDIALLELKNSVVYSAQIYPACLANYNAIGNAIVSGWGALQYNGPTSVTLQKATVSIMPWATCEPNLLPGYKVTPSMLCALVSNKDACQGDSGGPLAQRLTSDNAYTVVGITSWGIGCAATFPGVYTNVTYMKDWIGPRCPDCIFVGKND